MNSAPLQKKSTNDQADIKNLILDTAAVAFAEHGFSGTSLRDIGKTAGISFQSISYHFGNKEGLWEAVVEKLSIQGQEAGVHHEQVIKGLPVKDQLYAQNRAIIAYQMANPNLNKILKREAIKNSKRYKRVYPIYVKGFHELSGKFLERMQKQGVVRNDIPLDDLIFIFDGVVNDSLSVGRELYTGEKVNTESAISQLAEALTKILSNKAN